MSLILEWWGEKPRHITVLVEMKAGFCLMLKS